MVVMMTENVCSALKWGANTLEDRTHVWNIRRDDEERPFNRTTRYSAQAVVDHRFEERQSAHDQPGWRGSCRGEWRILRLPRASRGSASKRLSLLHRQRQRNRGAPVSGARDAGRHETAG